MPTQRRECHNLDDVLEVNRPVQVVFKKNKKKFIYKSSVADYEAGHILITPLTRGSRPAVLRNGEKIHVIYFAYDAMYEFRTTVTGHRKDNNVMLTVLEKPRRCDRVQRREFFRYPLSLKARFKRVEVTDMDGMRTFKPTGSFIECYFDDISGGGVSFHTSEELVDDSYVLFCFTLVGEKGKKDEYKEIIKIIRTKKINPLERRGDFEYTYGASFVTLKDEKQIGIIQYIMWRQITERKAARSRR